MIASDIHHVLVPFIRRSHVGPFLPARFTERPTRPRTRNIPQISYGRKKPKKEARPDQAITFGDTIETI